MDRKYLSRLIILGLCLGLIIVWAVSFTDAADSYEVKPEIRFDGYGYSGRGDVIGAYERLMDKYHSLVQSSLLNLTDDSRRSTTKLESIEKKLDDISYRLSRIETELKITQGNGR